MKKLSLLVIFAICVFTSGFIIEEKSGVTTKQETLVDTVLNENNVYNMLIVSGIKYPEIVMSQIMLESSNLKSTRLSNLGIQLSKIEFEECIYDTNIGIDNTWLNK